jgi:hypothetical protein
MLGAGAGVNSFGDGSGHSVVARIVSDPKSRISLALCLREGIVDMPPARVTNCRKRKLVVFANALLHSNRGRASKIWRRRPTGSSTACAVSSLEQ